MLVVAKAAGYGLLRTRTASPASTTPASAAMGIHYVNATLVGDGRINC